MCTCDISYVNNPAVVNVGWHVSAIVGGNLHVLIQSNTAVT